MNGINTATCDRVYIRNEIYEKSLAESDVYDPNDDLDLCLSETEEETTLVSRLTPLEDMQICTPGIKSPRQILQGGIRKAFGGETNSIKLRYRLKNMPWGEARKVWQTIANEMAEDCFGPDGNVDVERLKGWMKFLGDAETFKKEPFRFIPHVELMRSQMYVVCECLVLDRNGARDQLNAANGIAVGPHGRSLLAAMSQGRESPLSPTVAILASLFTPHRQWNLPTCTIHSIINAEIRNHPGWLVKVYAQMLQSDQCTLPSGYAVWQQSIQNGSITVDLRNGGKGRDDVFEDITGGDPAKIAEQIAEWQREGIEYDEAEKYKFKMPVYNMTDLLFANILQASNFGNRKIDDYREYGTMLIYAGHRERVEIYSSEIQVDDLNFLAGMAALKERGEAWRRLGCHYMRVSTTSSDGGHAENIDIDALLAFDPNNMETGKAYAISDCNYGDDDMSQDIPRLAVRKMGGTPPTYEFGTLWCGSQFEKVDVSMIWVYATDANVCDAEYWAQFQ
ncbi:MAG: hypothetical protein LBS22_03145 [Puniceicoccales bacterium]|jgi:hypothetical protein|nr:hypothetical protein [Puniceicoccales bacterium]